MCVMLAASAVGVLAFVDPTSSALFPRCLFHLATGLHCPGCGGQRAIHALMSGHVGAALGYNVLSVTLLPAAVAWWTASQLAPVRWRRWSDALPPRTGQVVAVVVIGFWILRNVPLAPFSLLAP